MLIDWVQIKNFRCIKNLRVEFANLTAFLGRNGSGKSTTLHALNAFYKIKADISADDFFNGDTSLPIAITVSFRDLGPEELIEFHPFIYNDALAVTKVIQFRESELEQKYYAAKLQVPIIAELRKERTLGTRRDRWNQLIEEGELFGISEKAPSKLTVADLEKLMNTYEELHPELMELIPEEVQFFGQSNIGGGKLDNYTKFVYVPAVRDATEESAGKRGSPLFQLLDFIVMRRFRARSDVLELQREYSSKLKGLYDPSKLTEFNELAVDISKTLQLYVPSAKFELRVEEPILPDVPSPATRPHLVEDGYEGSIDRKGHGLQRALIFSLLQHMAVAKPIEADDGDAQAFNISSNAQESRNTSGELLTSPDVKAAPVGPDLIIAIEEPELYQHPLRARHLSRILLAMSHEEHLGPGGRNQIIYTTHSPYFVDLERFDQLRVMRKNKETPEEPPCTGVFSYSLQAAGEKLPEVTGRPSHEFTAASFSARAYPVMTQTVNEGFFADAVVLVEGATEVAALLTVSNLIGSDWLSKGVALIPVEGKSKMDRAAVVFKGLGIPTYILFDGDKNCKNAKERSNRAKINRTLLQLCGAPEEDFPSSRAEEEYACFEETFEAYCRDEIGEKTYYELREKAAKEYGFQRITDGAKNFDVVVTLVNAIYEQGHKLALIENIIRHVDRRFTEVTSPLDETLIAQLGEEMIG